MSVYKNQTPEKYEEHFSNFLISSWSYSKATGFARNEKAFEMQHIYGLYSRLSVSSIAGNAYHTALEYYFFNLKEHGVQLPLHELQASAYQYIDNVAANKWKTTDTLPTIEQCMEKATKTVTALLENFYREKALYEDDIEEILHVELGGEAWLTVNGVDIPLPCRFKIDLVVRLKTGGIAIVDHKSKTSFTPEDEAVLTIGVQAMTYVLAYEEMTDNIVTEVWFMENKSSKNKDGGPQLIRIPVKIDDNSRRLYEALLYEPVKRMIAAVQDPDYIYLINESDNFVDKGELYDFWCRTMLDEFSVDSFNIEESKKDMVAKRLKKVRDSGVIPINPTILRQFKQNAVKFIPFDLSASNMTPQEKIEHVFRTFHARVQVAHTFEGYSSNTFLLNVESGVAISSLYKRRLDLANGLDVENVRMSPSLVRHEGKSYLAVEMPKERNGILLYNEDDQSDMRIPLGKDNYGRIVFWDAKNPSTPHVLVCGSSGSGKTELLKNTIRFAKKAGFSQIVVFDTKYTFNSFSDENVVVLNEVSEIERMADMLVKHMNKNVAQGKTEWILILFDEFADAYDQARSGADLKIYEDVVVRNYANGLPKYQQKCTGEIKSLQENMRMLLQKGRSSGIRIMQATQRASAKIIDGDAKVNFPVQICLKVPKEVDSKVVLDEAGAESLRGNGDALIKSPEYSDVVRFQSYYKPEEVHA